MRLRVRGVGVVRRDVGGGLTSVDQATNAELASAATPSEQETETRPPHRPMEASAELFNLAQDTLNQDLE